MKNKINIILASSSPRRIEIMKKNGYDPIVCPPHIDETLPYDMGMEEAVMFLALKKALAVKQELKNNFSSGIIIGADTVVFKDHIIGKPNDKSEAFSILNQLRNTSHFVATGVSLVNVATDEHKEFCEVTKVFFKNYTDEQILEYIRTDEPWDKAGGYAIQGAWGKHIDHYEGDLDNVIGFPWSKITEELSSLCHTWNLKLTNSEESTP